jgi:hypothetical protein
MLMPYVHVDNYHVSLADPVIRNCDLYLAVTGAMWFEEVTASISAHWQPKMVHVDLAVDRADFPRVKTTFNPPGSRRFVYIGHTAWYKNTRYLTELSRRLPEFDFSWIGSGDGGIPGLRPYGRQDFTTGAAQELVAGHDFLLTVGIGDANPTTILEAMSWGLVPVCTPESGYHAQPGIVNIPATDPDKAERTLRSLQLATADELRALQAANDRSLDTHFNWTRFTDQVVGAIESTESPRCLPLSRRRQAHLKLITVRRQASVLAPRQLRGTLRALLTSSRGGRLALGFYRKRTR